MESDTVYSLLINEATQMQYRKLAKRFTVVALTISFSFNSVTALAQDSKQAQEIQAPKTNAMSSAAHGRAEVRLVPNPEIGFNIQSFKNRSLDGILISLGGVPTKGKSKEELERLLLGPVDSELAIVFLDSSRDVRIVELKRTALKKLETNSYQDKNLQNVVGMLDHGNGLVAGGNGEQSIGQYEKFNLDLCVRAATRRWLDSETNIFNLKPSRIPMTLEWAVIYSDMIGDLSLGDGYLKQFIKIGDYNQTFGQGWNSPISRLLGDLSGTKRKPEGEVICDGLTRAARLRADTRRFNREDYENVRKASLKFLSSQNSAKSAAMLQSYVHDKKAGQQRSYYVVGESEDWFAKLLKAEGKSEEAAVEYSQLLKSRDISKQQKGKIDFGSALLFIRYTIESAAAQSKVGQIDAAIATDVDGLKSIHDLLTDEQLDLTEKIGPVSVSRSSIETQLAGFYLQQKKYEEAIELSTAARKHIESIFGSNSPLLRTAINITMKALAASGNNSELKALTKQEFALSTEKVDILPSEQEQFAIVRQCIDIGQKKDSAHLKNLVWKLLDIYEHRNVEYGFERPSLNLFCTILSQARVLADLSAFDESNKVLDRLKVLSERECTPSSAGFIDVEKALNSELRNKSDSALWAQINQSFSQVYCSLISGGDQANPLMKSIQANFSTQENLRRLAVIYSKAGQLKRAGILLHRAVDANDALVAATHEFKDTASVQITHDKIILLLDKARLKALNDNIAVANDEARQAMQLCADTQPFEREQDQFPFEQVYQFKIVELAKLFSRSEKSGSAVLAKDLLEAGLKTIDKAPTISAADPSRPRGYDDSQYILKIYLAQLYFKDKNLPEALRLISSVVEKAKQNPHFEVSMMMAEISSASGDFKTAAQYYSKAGEWSQVLNMGNPIVEQAWHREILKRATTCAEKALDLDASEMANLYIRYGTTLESDSSDASISYYKKAYDLIPDTDTNKVSLLRRIENTKARLQFEKQQMENLAAQKLAETKPEPIVKSQTVEKPATAGNTANEADFTADAKKIESAKRQIELHKTEARLAESSNAPDQWSRWLQLAQTEADAHMPAAAVEHAKKGIAQYERTGISMSPRTLNGVSYIAQSLAQQGDTTDAEILLTIATNRINSIYGSGSPYFAVQMANMANYYMSLKDFARALAFVDKSLESPVRSLELMSSSGSVIQALNGCQYNATKAGKSDLTLKIWDKIIDALKKGLSPDDQRLIQPLLKRAQLKGTLKDVAGALADRQEALSIKKLYDGEIASKEYERQLLPTLLRELGRDKEADLIDVPVEEPKGYVNPSYPFEHNRKVPLPGASPQEQITQLKDELKIAQAQAPYSNRTNHAVSQLLEQALKLKDPQLAHDMASLACTYYEHTNDSYAGVNFGCEGATPRINSYKSMITADLQLNKTNDAVTSINRAAANMPEVSYYENIELAFLALKCEDVPLSKKLAAQADLLLPYEDYIYNFRSNISDLWTKLGEPERAEKASKLQKEIVRQHDEKFKKMQTSPFARTGI